MKPKAGSLKKINIINKSLFRLTREKTRGYNLLVSQMKQGNITADPRYIKRIMREYYEQLDANKSSNMDKIDKLCVRHKLSKLTLDEIDNQTDP